ncbi:Inner membrane transport permease YbhS [Methylacidimicrobium cyclopophantes]|uniref:Inner membrane transport permease YbhS n=1 Tax=Methylacidimicrobium cyclopophantes TaxID=1041766 RepID=A0A5E6M9K6_9BACT|nr:ABC transporter permease [Methylacidimicrobium cyclopophantes]VVM05638.1 Inner membrane transport permease YbhS [Methylacidimicrobium cyclopophantes]
MRSGLVRFLALWKKEWIQIWRDPASIAIGVVLPAVLLLIYGYGISLDSLRLPIGVVVENPNPLTASFVAGLERSRYFSPEPYGAIGGAEEAMRDGKVEAILWLWSDFTRRGLREGNAPLSLIVNGVDANTARLLEGYFQGVWSQWLQWEANTSGQPLLLPVEVESRIWFNPALESRHYLAPGVIVINMTLVGALLTALVIAREWERGTMEALLSTPVSMAEILWSKTGPYFVLGMGGMAVCVVMAVALFGAPLLGSVWVLSLASALFLLSSLGMGLLISSALRSTFLASMVAIVATFLPAFILSGFIFDIASMPEPIRLFTYLFAARYFVTLLQTIFLAGNVWSVILPNLVALFLMAAFFLGNAWRISRRSLE